MSAPAVVWIAGPPGSGKTSTGRELARLRGWALVDLDTVTNRMLAEVMAARGIDDVDDPRLANVRARYVRRGRSTGPYGGC